MVATIVTVLMMTKRNDMIDIHCHILPGMDDGSVEPSEAKEMLVMQQTSGVERLFLTPHFYPEEKTIDVFLSERERAWKKLEALLTLPEKAKIRLGAEVRCCEHLLRMDLRPLTLGESDYLLLELPGERYPAYFLQFAEKLLGRGVIPVLAHIERCAYFRQEPNLLRELVDAGVLAQVSAQALFDKRDRNFSVACLRHGLVQIVASDAHNTASRKPCMEELRKLPENLQQLHEAVTSAVWENELPPYFRTTAVKKTFFGYR